MLLGMNLVRPLSFNIWNCSKVSTIIVDGSLALLCIGMEYLVSLACLCFIDNFEDAFWLLILNIAALMRVD